MRPVLLAASLVTALVSAGCSGGAASDASQEKAMKAAFDDAKKPIDQLPPAQRQSAEAMKAMAEKMAKGGNGAAR